MIKLLKSALKKSWLFKAFNFRRLDHIVLSVTTKAKAEESGKNDVPFRYRTFRSAYSAFEPSFLLPFATLSCCNKYSSEAVLTGNFPVAACLFKQLLQTSLQASRRTNNSLRSHRCVALELFLFDKCAQEAALRKRIIIRTRLSNYQTFDFCLSEIIHQG